MNLTGLRDTADYLAKQLDILAKQHLCTRCGKPLEKIYYRISDDLGGEYCNDCIHKIYRRYGLSFFARSRGVDDDED